MGTKILMPTDPFFDKFLRTVCKTYGFFHQNRYGLWGIREVMDFSCFSLLTNLVDPKVYGLLRSMGYESCKM